jgi:hypothetical protein
MLKRLILLFIVIIAFSSCSMQRKLSHKYVGEGVEILYRDFGVPKTTTVVENNNKILVFEKETFVKETIIGTGRTTLDPKISPAYTKVEVYRFEVDNQGIVVWTDYQKKIE